MEEQNEPKTKKKSGTVVFLVIVIILLVAAISVLATAYFTDSDFLKFGKNKAASGKEVEVEEETKENKKSKNTSADENSSSTEKKKTDLNSLITESTTGTEEKEVDTRLKAVDSKTFLAELEKCGIKCEKTQGTTGVDELYIGYDEAKSSSASYIKFSDLEMGKEYFKKQTESIVSQYSTIGKVEEVKGVNWENVTIRLATGSSIIYMYRVDNILFAISTDSKDVADSYAKVLKTFGY